MTDFLTQSKQDLGPLAVLIGEWQGDKGKDVSPEEDGTERNDYHETMIFSLVQSLDNAEEQALAVLSYHQQVYRVRDEKMIHNESGYLSWDKENDLLIKSFSIPRGVSVVAGGNLVVTDGQLSIEVGAALDNPDWPISQSPFMQQNASTKDYQFSLTLVDNCLTYQQSMTLDIYGKSFQHTDTNQLTKVE